jgi:hypothetical protein
MSHEEVVESTKSHQNQVLMIEHKSSYYFPRFGNKGWSDSQKNDVMVCQ